LEDAHPRLPRRAPQLSADQTRRAAAWMRPVDRQARDGLSGNFRRKRGAQGTAIAARQSGGLFLGYFLLAAQKKVTRPWVQEPTFKQLAAGAQDLILPLWESEVGWQCKVPSASLLNAGFRPRTTRYFCFGKSTQNHLRPYAALRVPCASRRKAGSAAYKSQGVPPAAWGYVHGKQEFSAKVEMSHVFPPPTGEGQGGGEL